MILSTHAQRLERWLGKDEVGRIAENMKDWYGGPIALAGVPGRVFACKGGDFRGRIAGGQFGARLDALEERFKRVLRPRLNRSVFGVGQPFANLSELIQSGTTPGRQRRFAFSKASISLASARAGTLFYAAGHPAGGVIAAGAPGGAAMDKSTQGAMPFNNPTGGLKQYLTSSFTMTSVNGNTVMLYDRLFSVAKTMNSTATEAVSGTPSRYQSSTSTDDDYAGSNFCFPEVVTALPATAHNWNVCQYLDEGGNAASFPSAAGVSSAGANTLDLASPFWFMPLATGDIGVKSLTQMQCSAAVATGSIAFTIGHPLAIFPTSPGGFYMPGDFINSAFNMVRIFDDACLSLHVMPTVSATATYSGEFLSVAN